MMIAVEDLRKLLDLGADGALRWKERPREMFASDRTWKIFNTRFATKAAINCPCGHGYMVGAIMKTKVYAHRVVWAMTHGEWPRGQIDHINGVRDDNRPENLRETDSLGNGKNACIKASNTSGVTGVTWHCKRGKWQAYITSDRKQRCIGSFKTKADAIAARKAAEISLGFSQNHGRAAS